MELRKQGAGRKMGSAVWAGNNVEISCLVKCNRKLSRGWNRVTYPLGFGTVSKAFFTCSLWSEGSLVKRAGLGSLFQPTRSDHWSASRTITKHWKSEDESPGLSAAGVPEAGEGGREKTGGPVHGASTGDMGQLRACGELKGRLWCGRVWCCAWHTVEVQGTPLPLLSAVGSRALLWHPGWSPAPPSVLGRVLTDIRLVLVQCTREETSRMCSLPKTGSLFSSSGMLCWEILQKVNGLASAWTL